MSSVSQMHGLAFLRPYAARGLQARPLPVPSPRGQAAYLSFYQSVQKVQRQTQRGVVGGSRAAECCRHLHITAARRREAAASSHGDAAKSPPAKQAAGAEGKKAKPAEAESDRSIRTKRIDALTAADALHYPRYQPQARRLSVPSFRAVYDAPGVVGEGPEPPETVQARPRVELSGRVLSVRRLGGKLLFCNILNEGQTVQVQCNLAQLRTTTTAPSSASAAEDAVAAFKQMARLLTRGDHVAVTGRAIRTSSGQLTLHADALPRVLSPALAPLPTHLRDADTRAQRRHIDLLVHPAAAATLRLRSRLLHELRCFFEAARFVEVQTPILADLAGGATARPFRTTHDSAEDGDAGTATGARALSLRIAPELWLKRLVVGGLERVYEIGPSFRNEGIDATHNPEFSMCEFYAAYWTLPRLMAETERLMAQLARAAAAFKASPGGAGLAVGAEGAEDTASEARPRKEESPPGERAQPTSVELCAAGGPFQQLEFVPALEAKLGFTFPDLEAPDAYDRLQERLATSSEDNRRHARGGGGGGGGRDLAKLLDRLAGDLLEPHSFAAAGGPLFIVHHPAVMSPLAKSFVCPTTGQRVAARAELFVDGRELANMYEEENDPAAQRRKMAAQRDRDRASACTDDGEAAGVDENYIAALESGLPPTGGWGCGIERLVMLFAGAPRIADCLSFGTLRHVVAMRER